MGKLNSAKDEIKQLQFDSLSYASVIWDELDIQSWDNSVYCTGHESGEIAFIVAFIVRKGIVKTIKCNQWPNYYQLNF